MESCARYFGRQPAIGNVEISFMTNAVQEQAQTASLTQEYVGNKGRLFLQQAFVYGRLLFGLLFLIGFVAKFIDGWLWSDALLNYFNARLLDPPAITEFQRAFLTGFAIPNYFSLSWLVTVGELPIGLGLLFAVQIRFCAISAVLMMLGFAAGGYADLSTMFLIAFAMAMVIYPLKKEDIG